MQSLSVVLACAFLFLVQVGAYPSRARETIPTDICEVSSRPGLVDVHTELNYERIACEGDQFQSYQCARYWVKNNEFTRKKLSFDKCSQLLRNGFHDWAGTSTANGKFQDDYSATISEETTVNDTMSKLNNAEFNQTTTLLIEETTTTLEQLYELALEDAMEERANTYTEEAKQRQIVSSQELQIRNFTDELATADRAFDVNTENTSRTLVDSDGTQSRTNATAEFDNTRGLLIQEIIATQLNDSNEEITTRGVNEDESLATQSHDEIQEQNDRDLDSQVELATRTLDIQEENSTRNFEQDQHNQLRELVEEEQAQVRQEEDNQQAQTISTWHADSDTFYSTITSAYATSSSATNTASDTAAQEIQQDVTNSATSDQNAATTAQTTVQSTWKGAYNAIIASLTSLNLGFPDQPLFETLAIHFDLENTHNRGFPSVEIYSRPGKLDQLRAIVNDTIMYNLAKYGRTSNSATAASYWSSAESDRNKGSYRTAAEKYSNAYVNAITPNYNTN